MGKLRALFFGVVVLVALIEPFAYAGHPNSGNAILSSLIEEAFRNNLEIKEAEKKYEASFFSRKQAFSANLPVIGFEGGYQTSYIDNESARGAFGYTRAAINLYRGGKDQAELDIRAEGEKFQKVNIQKIKLHIEKEISKTFYELLYLQEGLSVKEDALNANRAQMALAVKKKAAGYTSQADVLEYELREATLNSDINFLKREETTKERQLRRILGRTDELVIRVGGHLHRESLTIDVESLLDIALKERLDLKEAERNIVISNLNYKFISADYLPKVDLEGKYGKINSGDANNNSVVMLKVSIDLFSGFETTYGLQSRSMELAKNELSAVRIRHEIKVQIEDAYSRLRSIGERLNLEEKNIERSRKYYQITLEEYKRGVKNSPDLASAAERLFDSYLRNLEFRRDFYLAKLEIAEAAGISSRGLDKLSAP